MQSIDKRITLRTNINKLEGAVRGIEALFPKGYFDIIHPRYDIYRQLTFNDRKHQQRMRKQFRRTKRNAVRLAIVISKSSEEHKNLKLADLIRIAKLQTRLLQITNQTL